MPEKYVKEEVEKIDNDVIRSILKAGWERGGERMVDALIPRAIYLLAEYINRLEGK